MKRFIVTIHSKWETPVWVFEEESTALRAFRSLEDKGYNAVLRAEHSVRSLNITLREFIERAPYKIGAVYPDNEKAYWMDKEIEEACNLIHCTDGSLFAATSVLQASMDLNVDIIERFENLKLAQFVPNDDVARVLEYTQPKLLMEGPRTEEVEMDEINV